MRVTTELICGMCLIVSSTIACAQRKETHVMLGRQLAVQALQEALKNPLKPVAEQSKSKPLPDSISALRAAEPILFHAYGKQQVLEQKPYEVYLVNQYWVIIGTLSENVDGGTFRIILDSRNSQIVELTHGK
ncbi:YbbC/YhhH family protein [Hymenobacter sp. YC55]|uniref:YbbC/YhhH family protein n=1 Tax=Hymenobacter sp. YC55 TaxID=3034019 RepID=UPI0023F96942|nr:YbbC/YhhH family protein [Hymenobacter sp. YC55]MDF7811742.1 YbbC/YhhH family protein [Hymenobacter sp. YC55]